VTGIRAGGDANYSRQAAKEVVEPESSFDEVKYESRLVVEFKIQ
jgi:hypothetical protein